MDDEAENLEAVCELIIARHQTDTESVLNTVALDSMNNDRVSSVSLSSMMPQLLSDGRFSFGHIF